MVCVGVSGTPNEAGVTVWLVVPRDVVAGATGTPIVRDETAAVDDAFDVTPGGTGTPTTRDATVVDAGWVEPRPRTAGSPADLGETATLLGTSEMSEDGTATPTVLDATAVVEGTIPASAATAGIPRVTPPTDCWDGTSCWAVVVTGPATSGVTVCIDGISWARATPPSTSVSTVEHTTPRARQSVIVRSMSLDNPIDRPLRLDAVNLEV